MIISLLFCDVVDMKIKSKFSIIFLVLIGGIFFTLGSEPGRLFEKKPEVRKENEVLNKLIKNLSNYSIFRRKYEEIDNLIEKSCVKQRENRGDSDVTTIYACSPESEIEKVSLNYVQFDGENYVLSLSVIYDQRNYNSVKKIVQNRLGKHSEKVADMYRWHYVSDEKLNRNWHPLIYVTKNDDGVSAEFFLGLEGGP